MPPPYGAPTFPGPQFQGPQLPGPGTPQPQPYAPPQPHAPQPPPYAAPVTSAGPGTPVARPPQRPAVIALGASMAVVASLQWICGLSFFWVLATVGTGAFAQIGDNGAVFHVLARFSSRMLDGLAVPLYLFPLASFVTGFLVLSGRPWTRLLHTAVGLAALGWAAWWLQDGLLWWFSAAWYVVVACLVLWTPGATAWYRWRADERHPYPLG